MDDKPFLVLTLTDIDETLLPELAKLTKDVFDLDSVISAAGELKYIGEIKRTIAAQFREPADDWVRFLTTHVYEGSYTQRVREQFRQLVVKASNQFLNEQVNGRLKTALGSSAKTMPTSGADAAGAVSSESAVVTNLLSNSEIGTTPEELEAYQIVKAIACSEVNPQRITQRDAKSYLAILLDDNNRKPVARLHFNASGHKYLGLLDEAKKETRHPIESLDEIYMHAETIRAAVRRYKTG